LDCYKTHSTNCTEAFYKENIDEMLKSTKSTDEEKKMITETIKRVQEQDLLEQEEMALLDSLEGVDLDSPDLFNKLTKEDQQTFKNLIESGKITSLLPVWEPWWLKEPVKIFVKEVTEEEEQEETPVILNPIPPLSELTSKTPSPFLLFNLLDILYSYAYGMRYFNGDCQSDLQNSLSLFYDISSVLSSNQVFESSYQAISRSIENSLKSTLSKNSKEFSLAIIQDVVAILKFKDHILAALSDIYNLFGNYLKAVKLSKEKRNQFNSTQKKNCIFLIVVQNSTRNILQKSIYRIITYRKGTIFLMIPKKTQ